MIHYIANTVVTSTDNVPLIEAITGAMVAVVAAFIGLGTVMFRQAAKDRRDDRKERLNFAEAVKDMAKSNRLIADSNKTGFEKLTSATERTADEAKERNGHLAELIQQGSDRVDVIAKQATDNIIKGVQTVKEQHVEHQAIDNATIVKK